jgi:hypothetical protein
MAKNKSVKKLQQPSSKVPSVALESKNNIDYNEMAPVFRFGSADDNNWLLHDWQKQELKALIKCLKKMEKLVWSHIRRDTGLRMTKLKNVKPPCYLSPDIELYEIRVTQEQRIHGYLMDNIFYLVWFDRDHSVCPEGKNRTYGT